MSSNLRDDVPGIVIGTFDRNIDDGSPMIRVTGDALHTHCLDKIMVIRIAAAVRAPPVPVVPTQSPICVPLSTQNHQYQYNIQNWRLEIYPPGHPRRVSHTSGSHLVLKILGGDVDEEVLGRERTNSGGFMARAGGGGQDASGTG